MQTNTKRFRVPRSVAAVTAVTGGVLWMVYGLLAMLRPWGIDVVYRAELGYSVVIAAPVFLAYNLPGSLALVLTATALLGISADLLQRDDRVTTATRWLGYVAWSLGVISLAGAVLLIDPVFTAARIFGTLALGGATVAAAVAARQACGNAAGVALLAMLGVLAVFLLPLWPLVYMVGWLTEGMGAVIFALFGTGWLVIGWRLARESGDPNPGS